MTSIYDTVNAALHLQLRGTNLTRADVLQFTPPGWLSLTHRMYDFLDHYDRGSITDVYLDRGLLTFKGVDHTGPHGFVNRVAYTIAGESAVLCMITGGSGIRRKSIDGWPCLNRLSYIAYINEEQSQDTDHGI